MSVIKNIFQKIIFLLALLLTQLFTAQNHSFKNGDLLFININCGPMCDAINAVTQGYNNEKFNHMGLVVVQNGETFVYEAIGKAVVKTPIKTFLAYSKDPIYVGELLPEYQKLIPNALTFSENQLGIPYDSDFIYNNGKYYCSELIYDAFLTANNNQPFFQLFPMTYKEPNSADYFPIWVTHFKKQGIEIPEEQPGCNPGGMSLDNKITLKRIN
ncbi:hypothetical protein K5I29_12565 [Flavobacterium agricola]|uniref:Permuted papain-like amidase YaeF/Yiix C92 family enzyme n=1 Tax=Flavobacterium agricola TaxID=2870839 RepID=A0ABY6LY48_9FLAO|nr:YiiX/YebB-like N1pC/P60 family cysteine hydrolase [Flavobacterium agricola]UYW01264.1 hypothetical protein K5I29_12565 [Flavobacterium agricola]